MAADTGQGEDKGRVDKTTDTQVRDRKMGLRLKTPGNLTGAASMKSRSRGHPLDTQDSLSDQPPGCHGYQVRAVCKAFFLTTQWVVSSAAPNFVGSDRSSST